MIYGEESPSIFVKLSDPMRTQFQNEILLTLEACQDSSLNNQLEYFIGDVASSLYNEEKNQIANEKKW